MQKNVMSLRRGKMQQKPPFQLGWPGIAAAVCLGIIIGICTTYTVLLATMGSEHAQASTPAMHQAILTEKPTATKLAVKAVVVPVKATRGEQPVTHDRPQLAGPISDFYGKFGQVQPEAPSSDGTITAIWTDTAGNGLIVHYVPVSGVVSYISYNGPADWSKAQYKAYLLTFAPDNYAENAQANSAWQNQGGDPYNPIAYMSPTIASFALHVSDGNGSMNIV